MVDPGERLLGNTSSKATAPLSGDPEVSWFNHPDLIQRSFEPVASLKHKPQTKQITERVTDYATTRIADAAPIEIDNDTSEVGCKTEHRTDGKESSYNENANC